MRTISMSFAHQLTTSAFPCKCQLLNTAFVSNHYTAVHTNIVHPVASDRLLIRIRGVFPIKPSTPSTISMPRILPGGHKWSTSSESRRFRELDFFVAVMLLYNVMEDTVIREPRRIPHSNCRLSSCTDIGSSKRTKVLQS